MKTRRLVLLALLTAIALTIFMLEAQIPAPVPIPGVKLGLSNIVTVFTVFLLGPGEGCLVLAARIFLGAVFAGNFSTILYSAAGGGLAILVTILLRRVLKEISSGWRAAPGLRPTPWGKWPWRSASAGRRRCWPTCPFSLPSA